MKLEKAQSKEQFNIIEKLAKEVWEQHYTAIIGADQVAYMLEKFQSATSMMKQLDDGYIYFIIKSENEPVGYLSIQPRDVELFLSKIYVLKKFQGQGLGRFAMNFVFDEALRLQKQKVSLTVNKYNTDSIKVYEKIGFKNIDAVVTDIGNGYVMDDYIMVKEFLV